MYTNAYLRKLLYFWHRMCIPAAVRCCVRGPQGDPPIAWEASLPDRSPGWTNLAQLGFDGVNLW